MENLETEAGAKCNSQFVVWNFMLGACYTNAGSYTEFQLEFKMFLSCDKWFGTHLLERTLFLRAMLLQLRSAQGLEPEPPHSPGVFSFGVHSPLLIKRHGTHKDVEEGV